MIRLQLNFSCKGGEALGGRLDKAKARLKTEPSDYTYSEAKSLLQSLGFEEYTKGKSSGSRVMFVRDGMRILLHKPHPGNEMKQYAVRQLKEQLELMGEL